MTKKVKYTGEELSKKYNDQEIKNLDILFVDGREIFAWDDEGFHHRYGTYTVDGIKEAHNITVIEE